MESRRQARVRRARLTRKRASKFKRKSRWETIVMTARDRSKARWQRRPAPIASIRDAFWLLPWS